MTCSASSVLSGMWKSVGLLWVLLGACSRGSNESSKPVDASSRSEKKLAVAAPLVSSTATPSSLKCRLTSGPDTIDDGEGRGSAEGKIDLENVRVLANDKVAIVTWERQSNFMLGDSWREPHGTVLGGESHRTVSFPVHAYACATYGFISPGTLTEPFVVWGQANTEAFETWSSLPQMNGGDTSPKRVITPPVRVTPTSRQSIGTFVASRDLILAETIDVGCEQRCNCSAPSASSLWLYSVHPARRWSKRIMATSDTAKRPNAPALAVNEQGGAMAYRSGDTVYLAWLDGAGVPKPAVKLDSGDVGAPALSVFGHEAVIVWASRASKADRYRLRWMRVVMGEPPAPPETIETAGAAYAPAVLADEKTTTLAWMEGDSGRAGDIHISRVRTGSPVVDSLVVSTGEPNARDPELSASAAAPFLVYSTFTKDRPGGVVRYARISCE